MRALLIDDETFMLKLLAHQLSRLGIVDVATFEQADAALAVLEAEPSAFDVVLCDLQMPGTDGVEVVRRLAALSYRGGLVLVSGENPRIVSAVGRLAKAQKLNVLGVVHKPFSREQISDVLQAKTTTRSIAQAAQATVYDAEELRQAIAGGQMRTVYQPKVVPATGRLVGVETLVRWHHPTDGVVFPDRFIALAEEHGLIDELTRVVSSAAMDQARQWQRAGIELHVAVNVSMDNLSSLRFPDAIASELKRVDLDASKLVLEVTESRLMKDPVAALDILTRLRLKRIVLSIDDFGTGHSSLAQLRDLPFDELKIDRSFVAGAHRDAALRAIFDGSLAMARRLGMKVVAEGVGDRDDWDFLRAAGCDIAQGYFIGRPMSAAELEGWIVSWRARGQDLGF